MPMLLLRSTKYHDDFRKQSKEFKGEYIILLNFYHCKPDGVGYAVMFQSLNRYKTKQPLRTA